MTDDYCACCALAGAAQKHRMRCQKHADFQELTHYYLSLDAFEQNPGPPTASRVSRSARSSPIVASAEDIC